VLLQFVVADPAETDVTRRRTRTSRRGIYYAYDTGSKRCGNSRARARVRTHVRRQWVFGRDRPVHRRRRSGRATVTSETDFPRRRRRRHYNIVYGYHIFDILRILLLQWNSIENVAAFGRSGCQKTVASFGSSSRRS